MGFFDRWHKGSHKAEITRDILFHAANSTDPKCFTELCREHEEWIITNYESWTKVPVEIRSDSAAVQAYVSGLMRTAQFFAANGHPELLAMIMPTSEENPLLRWSAKLATARELLESGDGAGARPIVEDAIREMGGCRGSGIDEYLPKAWGLLGEIHFRDGDFEKARQATAQALDLCRHCQDHKGTVIYCGNLAEIARVRGDRAGNLTWLHEGIEAAQAAGLEDDKRALQLRLKSHADELH